jgi:hypothetical protein
MENFIIISLLILILGAAAFAVRASKKSGKKCIGCPNSSNCQGICGACQKISEEIVHQ